MRHLEKFQISSTSSDGFDVKSEYFESLDMKSEYFDDIEDMKEQIPDLLDENFIKQELCHEKDSLIGANLNLDDNDSGEEFDPILKSEVKKNRRKATAPQRAIQIENGSIGNSSESSQDLVESLGTSFMNNQAGLCMILGVQDNIIDPAEGGDILNEINEDDIFKDLQEEADGEKIDSEILDNVKEEWRAHWGIKCNMCEQVFPHKFKFDEHYTTTYNLVPVYTCTFCNKTAEKYSTFRSHCYRHITEGRYKCDECSKGFSLRSMLHVHILAKHTKAKPFICEECGRSFVTKPGLKIHLKKHKTETKEDYPCVECGKILHTRGGLTSHMNVHRLGRRFMCDVCGKTFTQKVNMQQHVKQHTGDKPHVCDKCGKTFAEKSHLARHYSFHSDVRPFKCKVCQKMYKTERCLKVHSLVHAEARPFVCDYCHKGFLSSTKLKQHYNIHTGERPYKCKYCERTFTNYPNWLKHTRRRHKVDHKTGAELEPKPTVAYLPKEESAPAVVVNATVPSADPLFAKPQLDADSEQILADISMLKTEDLLQQGLLNFTPVDDKFLMQPQLDLNSGGSSMGLLVPYFQSTLPSHQTLRQPNTSTVIPLQLSEFLHTSYIQQTLPCD